MSNRAKLNTNINEISITPEKNSINVINTENNTQVEVTQPLTSLIEITSPGLQGPKGDPGESPEPFLIYSGSISASVNTNNNIFTLESGSEDIFIINQNEATLKSNIFLIKNTNEKETFKISESIAYFYTHSQPPTNPVDVGGLYFTSSSFYVSLKD